jgi:signal recognition particle GTPase
MATGKLSENKDKKFSEMLEKMASAPKWTFRPWRETMESQLSSWTMYLPGVGSSTEAQELKNFKSMLDAMTDNELDNPEKINGPARERIARAASRNVDDVARMVYFYKQSLVLFTWLQLKKQKGEQLPSTENELNTMQENDMRVRTIAAKIMQPKGKTGRGRRLPF